MNHNIPKSGGIFDITINGDIIYKTLKSDESVEMFQNIKGKGYYNLFLYVKKNILDNIDEYNNTIMNAHKDKNLGKYIHPCLSHADDGSYTATYINNHVLMRDIEKYDLSLDNLKIIKEQIDEIFTFLKHNFPHINGDWFPQNILYSLDEKRVINIDAEGFFTYDEEYHMSTNNMKFWVDTPYKAIMNKIKRVIINKYGVEQYESLCKNQIQNNKLKDPATFFSRTFNSSLYRSLLNPRRSTHTDIKKRQIKLKNR